MSANLPQSVPQNSAPDDEIDLVALITTLWEGKWTIIFTTGLICALTVVGLRVIKMPFEATTAIRPISTITADEYAESNALGFFEVSEGDLESLFIENLREGRILEDAVKRIPLFEQEQYDSDAEYQRTFSNLLSLSNCYHRSMKMALSVVYRAEPGDGC